MPQVTPPPRRYRYPQLDDIEDLEKYRQGGYHPVFIRDVLAQGRYTILHKLGSGGSSTVWLARDQTSGLLLTLKILRAELSSKHLEQIAELNTSRELEKFYSASSYSGKQYLQRNIGHFFHQGPNGNHLCLTFPLAGINILSISDSPGRVSGSRRLRGDLARKVAHQVALAVGCLHTAGIVHGDITSSNVLFQVSDHVLKWVDNEVWHMFGAPQIDQVRTLDDSPLGSDVPEYVVAPINNVYFARASLLKEEVILVDFGTSFRVSTPPLDHIPVTPLHYRAPESWFDSKVSVASDVWALACTIYEIRSGSPLFDPFWSDNTGILKQVVQTLEKLPEPWWSSWDIRSMMFNESGTTKPEEEQKAQGVKVRAIACSIRQLLRNIGENDDSPEADEGTLIEKTGTRLQSGEIGSTRQDAGI